MQIHNLVFVPQFLRQLEEETHLEGAVLDALLGLGLCLLVLAKSVETARLVNVDILVLVAALNKLIVDLHGLAAPKTNRLEYVP